MSGKSAKYHKFIYLITNQKINNIPWTKGCVAGRRVVKEAKEAKRKERLSTDRDVTSERKPCLVNKEGGL